jgi:hypothetical protein
MQVQQLYAYDSKIIQHTRTADNGHTSHDLCPAIQCLRTTANGNAAPELDYEWVGDNGPWITAKGLLPNSLGTACGRLTMDTFRR